MKHSTLLEKEIAKHNRTLKVLVQVNTSKEEQKGGATPEMVRIYFPNSLIRDD